MLYVQLYNMIYNSTYIWYSHIRTNTYNRYIHNWDSEPNSSITVFPFLLNKLQTHPKTTMTNQCLFCINVMYRVTAMSYRSGLSHICFCWRWMWTEHTYEHILYVAGIQRKQCTHRTNRCSSCWTSACFFLQLRNDGKYDQEQFKHRYDTLDLHYALHRRTRLAHNLFRTISSAISSLVVPSIEGGICVCIPTLNGIRSI